MAWLAANSRAMPSRTLRKPRNPDEASSRIAQQALTQTKLGCV